LVLNIWHNAQYVLFVWAFNTNRFKGSLDEKARFRRRPYLEGSATGIAEDARLERQR